MSNIAMPFSICKLLSSLVSNLTLLKTSISSLEAELKALKELIEASAIDESAKVKYVKLITTIDILFDKLIKVVSVVDEDLSYVKKKICD